MSNDSLVARCKGTDCNVRVSFWQKCSDCRHEE